MAKTVIHNRMFYPAAMTLALAVAGLFAIDMSNSDSGKLNHSVMSLPGNELGSLKNADAWFNSKPITAPTLKGKVVLIQFGTYTCINWIRTLPYVRAWNEKYRDKGLIIIGVHTPEFQFEKKMDNIRNAMKHLDIDFPIAVDNKQEIWNAFSNRYWPALYFMDAKGRIRHHQFGEGEYDQSEKVIQLLLRESGQTDVDNDLVLVKPQGVELAADWGNLKSPENYLGYERTENFTGNRLFNDKAFDYTAQAILTLNQWSVTGNWTAKGKFIQLNKTNGRIKYRFQARDLHLVMGPSIPGSQVKFRVLINGMPPGSAHGIDTDVQGNGIVTEQRMYQLIRQPRLPSELEFEIEFFNTGIEAFAFTFG
jgi:thiol-disulfide isomerase/thioredoxin